MTAPSDCKLPWIANGLQSEFAIDLLWNLNWLTVTIARLSSIFPSHSHTTDCKSDKTKDASTVVLTTPRRHCRLLVAYPRNPGQSCNRTSYIVEIPQQIDCKLALQSICNRTGVCNR